jgi:hypothetical protein
VIICGGTRDIAKNEANDVLRTLSVFDLPRLLYTQM